MLAAALALVGLLVWVAADSWSPGPAPERAAAAAVDSPQAAAAGTRGAKVRLMRTRFGRILFNAKGRALYLFTSDARNESRCYGECAAAWPPFKTRGKPRAGKDVKQRLLGTTRRRGGGKQVTYRGHPLYFYIGDRAPGQVLCQNVLEFGGLWLVVNRRGRAVR